MNYTSKYNYSEDLYDTSSLLFIYDDVLFSHTIDEHETTDLFSLDGDDYSDDLFSFDDASDISVLSQRRNILQDKVAPNKDVPVSSQWETPNPRRWETVEPAKPAFHLPDLVRLDENSDWFDDSYDDDDLSIESKAALTLLGGDFSPHHNANKAHHGKKKISLSSRVQIPRYFPSYKDILLSKYFFVWWRCVVKVTGYRSGQSPNLGVSPLRPIYNDLNKLQYEVECSMYLCQGFWRRKLNISKVTMKNSRIDTIVGSIHT